MSGVVDLTTGEELPSSPPYKPTSPVYVGDSEEESLEMVPGFSAKRTRDTDEKTQDKKAQDKVPDTEDDEEVPDTEDESEVDEAQTKKLKA